VSDVGRVVRAVLGGAGGHVRGASRGLELQLSVRNEGAVLDPGGGPGRAVVREDRNLELRVLRQRGAGVVLGAGSDGTAQDAAAEEARRGQRERGGGRGVAGTARGAVVKVARRWAWVHQPALCLVPVDGNLRTSTGRPRNLYTSKSKGSVRHVSAKRTL